MAAGDLTASTDCKQKAAADSRTSPREESAGKARSSNFELLRVVAMLMIVVHHIYVHCINAQLTDADSIARMYNGLFCEPVFYKRLLPLSIFNSWGPTANAVFILISGYFMRAKGYRADLLKIAKKLLGQLAFACVLLVLAATVVFACVGDYIYLNLQSITIFNGGASWFIGYYFIVILVGAVFLNAFLQKLDQKGYATFLVVMFALTQFYWPALVLDNIGSGLTTTVMGIFLYALGGYLQAFRPFEKVRTYAFVLGLAVIYTLVFISQYNTTQTSIETYLRGGSNGTFYQSVLSFGNNSIVVICAAVCLFEIFHRVKIPTSKFINYLGQSTLMIYLVHDNSFFYSLWDAKDWISVLYWSPRLFFVELAAWAVGAFAIGLLVFAAFRAFERLLRRAKFLFLRAS